MPPHTAAGDHQKHVERHHDRNRSLFRQHRPKAVMVRAYSITEPFA
jgi:hypothetical protein